VTTLSAFQLTYIIGTYPSLTTTFIDREIEGMLEQGVDVKVVSIRRPHTMLSDRQRELQQHVSYLLPPNPWELVLACFLAFGRHPVSTSRLLLHLLKRPHGRASRVRTALHFVTGVYAARRLRNRQGVPIHAHFVDRAAIVARVAAALIGSNYSVTAHANDIYVDPVLLPEKFRHARFAVTCTEANRQHLEGLLGRDIARKLVRIYHGVDLAEYSGRTPARADQSYLLSVGQLKEKKGLRYLLEAIASLAERWPELHCDIVGEGSLREDLQQLADQLGVTERVRLVGALAHPDVIGKYDQSPIFVLPSVVAADGDRDGIPNVILEALASRLPVIASAISGIPEVVHHERTGLLVQPGDVPALAAAIERLLEDPNLRGRLGEAGRELVMREFEQRANVARLLSEMTAHA
jgi:colanic acid/amylovoran biosynthesis glycosyltransferase